ncbi:phage tail tape measure protein [Lichenifustis flavocetrariae]|uniref:Phage tail tape measure protein n=1 Tax=Lichenifustis flavocetrariae TaxID=2949735 RepID=A0AA41YZM4_9HYPH|nr:phage tail tape measure protein [Lichenifustis flavocetrariae]MCW6510162.1 phage tail tape measure protein [Lichenifustis flavocetrariae]
MTKGQKKAFQQLGLDAAKIAKAMQKDAFGTTPTVMEKLAKLPKYKQAATASELFGNGAKGLNNRLGNIDLLRKSPGMVAKETDCAGSANAQYDARAATTANNVQLFKNHVTALGKAIGDSLLPALNSAMAATQPFVRSVADLSSANPKLVSAIVVSTAAVIGFQVAAIGLRYAVLFGKAAVLDLALAFWRVGAASKASLALVVTPFRGDWPRRARVGPPGGAWLRADAWRRAERAGALDRRSDYMIVGPFRRITWAARAASLALASTAVGTGIVGLAAAGRPAAIRKTCSGWRDQRFERIWRRFKGSSEAC